MNSAAKHQHLSCSGFVTHTLCFCCSYTKETMPREVSWLKKMAACVVLISFFPFPVRGTSNPTFQKYPQPQWHQIDSNLHVWLKKSWPVPYKEGKFIKKNVTQSTKQLQLSCGSSGEVVCMPELQHCSAKFLEYFLHFFSSLVILHRCEVCKEGIDSRLRQHLYELEMGLNNSGGDTGDWW